MYSFTITVATERFCLQDAKGSGMDKQAQKLLVAIYSNFPSSPRPRFCDITTMELNVNLISPRNRKP